MLRFLRRPPPEAQALPWLLCATTNACLDRLRHRGRRDESWRSDARAALGEDELTIEGLVEAKDACRRLLGHFDAKTGRVAALVLVDGRSQDEVAALLGVTRTAIAKRLQRFLRDPRKILGVSETARRTSSG
jgi:DNA-directed RNA polymerase specialized sigma24 family protein